MKQAEGFELSGLRFIRDRYGDLIQASAARHGHRPEVVAGIMMRETEGGLSRWCDPQGPACLGDNGHGHGLMQIDDRSFPEYCAGSEWNARASPAASWPPSPSASTAATDNGTRIFTDAHEAAEPQPKAIHRRGAENAE